MSRTLKAIIIGGVFMLLGLVIFLVGYFSNNRKADSLLEFEIRETTPLSLKSYDAPQPDSITMISIITKRMPVTIQSHEEQYIRLEYYENPEQSFEITQAGGKLIVKKNDLGFFKENILLNLKSLLVKEKQDNGITVYMPSSYTGELLVSTTFGDISVRNALAFSKIKKIDFKNYRADIKMNSLSGNILNLMNTGGIIECSDISFEDITVISANADVKLNYISSDYTDFLINKSSLQAAGIISDNIKIETVSSQIDMAINAYSVQYSVVIEKSEKSQINLTENIVENADKRIRIKADDSIISVSFSLD
ncbi:MAG TPA: DUF4097 family beta strand repeat-containing protein [Clostridia bacterium]|jgi:hypothetical protein|nr:DUF4097 domain-containing protein [Clostridiaceae bacterium]HOF27258.1 DUF4097 family beta strand repeat-containing protein [Clostridia bacterium]HOM35184.1 DUF4097 family beta strand repeat-containing protein [Clostridia bacterium]HOR90218.1 DUF4097 family beta strand repeat-containing protein [Clostridia bacterium]HOT71090.1 DUF4097 family beta strand repeat-containing protein [Clostridia bacterium]